MMKLYLVRHAIAEDHHPISDAERALTPKGRIKMAEQAKGLGKIRFRPEIILTSPLRRALETAAIIGEVLGIKVEQLPELGPGSYMPADVLAALQPHANLKEIALVGHQPGLGELAAFMLTGSTGGCDIEFKKGGVVCLEQLAGDIQDRYALIWSMPPKALRSL
jgi:phosphohistidine phosphatase